jgi:hypothetical protein
MATVEKITYQPLIDHLKEEEDYYSHLLVESEMKYGAGSDTMISVWMVNIIEPLLIELTKNDSKQIGKFCKVFFKELLHLSQKGNLQELTFSYYKSWLITPLFADVFAENPDKIVLAFSSAIHSIYRYQPKGLDPWLDLMRVLLPAATSLKEVLALGRIASWMVGMAHLRELAWEEYQLLRDPLKKLLAENFRDKDALEACMNSPYAYKGDGKEESLGGFIALPEGLFNRPPVVAYLWDSILATDGENTCALFADACGKVVMENISVKAELVLEAADSNAKVAVENSRNPYNDLSSVVQVNNLMVFTRLSSFKLFIRA